MRITPVISDHTKDIEENYLNLHVMLPSEINGKRLINNISINISRQNEHISLIATPVMINDLEKKENADITYERIKNCIIDALNSNNVKERILNSFYNK